MNLEVNIEPISSGAFGQKCYVVNVGDSCVLVDPGGRAEIIVNYLSENKLVPLAILITHGHFDHIGAVSALLKEFTLPVYMSDLDKSIVKQAPMLRFITKSNQEFSGLFSWNDMPEENGIFDFGHLEISYWSTPGHTPGSYCFGIQNEFLLTGDTLLRGNLGSSVLPGGNSDHLKNSIDFLMQNSNETMVYPGHGSPMKLIEYRNLFLEVTSDGS